MVGERTELARGPREEASEERAAPAFPRAWLTRERSFWRWRCRRTGSGSRILRRSIRSHPYFGNTVQITFDDAPTQRSDDQPAEALAMVPVDAEGWAWKAERTTRTRMKRRRAHRSRRRCPTNRRGPAMRNHAGEKDAA